MRIPLSLFRRAPILAGSLCLAIAALSGCASKNPLMTESDAPSANAAAATSGVQTFKERRFLGILSPYRPDIQQGNFVSREMVAQLKESLKNKSGMTREQVRFVMGTPLLNDVFHKDRWDYPFRLEKSNGVVIASHVALFFQDNRLVRLEGGDLPTEKNYLALIAGSLSDATPGKAPGAK